jgi:hypothetical protein
MKRYRTAQTGAYLLIFALLILFTSKAPPATAHAHQPEPHPTGDPFTFIPLILKPAGPEWTTSVIDGSHGMADMGDHSLRLTSNNRPRVAYGSSHLYYAHLEDTGWVIDTVDSASGVGRYTSLALDDIDLPYISYYDATNKDLKLAHWNGSDWDVQTIDAGNLNYGAGRDTAIALDDNNWPAISYLGNDYNTSQAKYLDDLKYAKWNGSVSSWSILTLDSSDNIGGYISMGLDSDGHPHISYYDDDYNNNLKYIQYTGSSWFQVTFDLAGNSGDHSSIAVAEESLVYISYFSEDKDRLKMVTFHNEGMTTKIETVDSNSSAGQYTSIALDSHGYPHIAYYDFSKKDLKYARWTGLAWVITTLDSTGDVGKFASLALDSHDLAHITYYDATNKDLKYAVRNYQTP